MVAADAEYMRLALQLAERGRGQTSPNPMVGALVVSPDGVIVGTGYHERAGTPHAEVLALRAAGTRARGATLYCSLEPCCHTGRTGPCTNVVIDAGIRRVVAAMADPNPLVAGRGFAQLRAHGIEVVCGIREAEARRLNEVFVVNMRDRRPFVIVKIAMTLDGRIAAAAGQRTAISGRASQRHAQIVRAEVDAIGVGSGTVLVDDPRLTARDVFRMRPLTRVLFDTRLRMPSSARVLATRDQGPIVVVTSPEAMEQQPDRAKSLRDAGADLIAVEGRDLKAALGALLERGVTSLLLEGGAVLHEAAWKAGVVDRVRVYVAPHVLGPDAMPWVPAPVCSLSELRGIEARPLGEDVLIEGHVHRAD